jgi:hypothetical protein
MIRQGLALCICVGSLAWGQAGSPPSSQPIPAPSQVPIDATVLTIKGFCPGRESSPPCETAITRAQFEALVSAIQPTMSDVVKRQFASLYPRLLVMTHEAEAKGLDKDPKTQQLLTYARMQILSEALTRKLQDESTHVSDADLNDYYNKHLELFQAYQLERMLIPLHHEPTSSETPQQRSARQSADAEEMTKLAETLRARAASGEDFKELQKEAFDIASVKVSAINTDMGLVRPTTIPPAHLAVLKLKAGDVSEVITDGAGHYIYKLEGREQLRLDQVRDEVRGTLISERLRAVMHEIQSSYSAETNNAYFSSQAPPPAQAGDEGHSSAK